MMQLIFLMYFLIFKQINSMTISANHTIYDLSNSRQIIHSFGNKFIHENRTTRISQLFKKRINHIDDTGDLLSRINYLLNNQSIFKNVTTNKTFHTRMEFNFNAHLVTLLHQMNITSFKILIRQYLRHEYFLKMKSNITIYNHTNLTEADCLNMPSEDHFVNFCYKRKNTTILLDSIMFKLKRVGNYIICVQFVTNSNKIIHFPNDYLCLDWINDIVHDDSTRLRYKPLFIVIMYLMCASILFPIAIGKHFLNKLKLEKKEGLKLNIITSEHNNKNKTTSSSSVKSFKNENSSKDVDPLLKKTDSGLLINQLNNNININNHQSIKKVVLFDITGTAESESDNECDGGISAKNKLMVSEANHILNDKPWLQSGPVVNDYRTNLNNLGSKMERKVSSEIYLNNIKLHEHKFTHLAKNPILKNSSNESDDDYKTKTTSCRSLASSTNIFSNINNRANVYYESNV